MNMRQEKLLFIRTILSFHKTIVHSTLLNRHMLAEYKSSILHHLTRKFVECARTKMQHIVYVIVGQELLAQLLKRGKEHPTLHIDLRHFSVWSKTLHTHLHEYREEVSLSICIVIFHILAQHIIKPSAAHIWWIHTKRSVFWVNARMMRI